MLKKVDKSQWGATEQLNFREGLYYLETVFAKFVPVGKDPVFDGSHGNQPKYLMYG